MRSRANSKLSWLELRNHYKNDSTSYFLNQAFNSPSFCEILNAKFRLNAKFHEYKYVVMTLFIRIIEIKRYQT